MNDYSLRARFYEFEFSTQDDFRVIKHLLSADDKPLAEIPCGSGRLLPMHRQFTRTTYLVDLEENMIRKVEDTIIKNQLSRHLFPVVGDMRNWGAPELLSLILVPRGGIQLLDREDIGVALFNLGRNLEPNGAIYLDIANPWMVNQMPAKGLPVFMQFNGTSEIAGENIYEIPDGGKLCRRHRSILNENYVTVQFVFEATYPDKDPIIYKSTYRWSRLDVKDLKVLLKNSGLEIVKLFGDYESAPFTSSSSRLICIAKKKA